MPETEPSKSFKLPHAPIVEAVLDIDCDLPPDLDPTELERAGREAFGPEYPKFRKQFIHEAEVMMKAEKQPRLSARQGVQGFRFIAEDEKQLVQTRINGFSFNRLTPYTTLDDYLPEIERCWALFLKLAEPRLIRKVGLRYINRIVIPAGDDGNVELDDYLRVGLQLPDESGLIFTGFLNQHQAVDPDTGNQANIVLASQPPEEGSCPFLLDIAAWHPTRLEPLPFSELQETVASLRSLKNHIFRYTLTEKCLDLFQQPPAQP